MKVIKAPHEFNSDTQVKIFLAGSIEEGAAEQWQENIAQELAGYNITILNPRRDNWDSSWVQSADNPQFKEQVEWELDAQEKSDIIVFYFAPQTKSPISLLELGLFARSKKVVVCCSPEFWREGNVEIVCKRYNIPYSEDWADFIKRVKELVEEKLAALNNNS